VSNFAPNILLACLFGGLILGGLRSPWCWLPVAATIWMLALRSPHALASRRVALWAVWLGWALLSLCLSNQPWKGLYSFARWSTLAAFFALTVSCWKERQARFWFWGLAVTASVLAIAALLIRSPHGTLIGLIPPYYNYTMFVQAAFVAAAAAALWHPHGPTGRARQLLLAALLLALTTILLARSRSALWAVFFAVALLVLGQSSRIRIRHGIVFSLAAAGLLACLPDSLWSYWLKFDMARWFTRPQIWKAAWQVAADHPLLGEGIGNFAQGFVRHNFQKSWATNYGFWADHAHSEPLEILAETGWPGLILFLAALWAGMRVAWPRKLEFAPAAAAAALAAMGAQCLIDNMLHLPALGLLFFSALACMSAGSGPALSRAMPFQIAGRAIATLGLGLTLLAVASDRLLAHFWERAKQEHEPARRLAWLQRVEQLTPEDFRLHEELARCRINMSPPQLDRALAELRLAAQLNPTNALYPVMQAEILLRQGHWSEAAALLDQGITLEPNFLGARLLRAQLRLESGQRRRALWDLAEISRRRPALPLTVLYSGYDRTIAFLDQRRFDALSARANQDYAASQAVPLY
jgi:hypothetical protein